MRFLIKIVLTFIAFSTLSAQNQNFEQSKNVIMTIRGFDYFKSDGLTEGAHLNNPNILDTVVSYLRTKPHLKVELHYYGSCHHTSKAYWDHLTKGRAEACKNYLVSKGIDENRIRPIGKGIRNLLANCNCGECSEEEHNLNQRMEIIKIE